jgi:pimeloyl-ACP methyl ester carboxylesterase
MPAAISDDGTPIAYSVTGSGPLVVLVDGAMCHRALGPTAKLVPILSTDFTVVSYDRRARGESGNTTPYSVDRELEDLATVVAAAGDGPVMLLGMSSGAALALRAVSGGLPVTRLALFEPPFVGAGGPGALPPRDAHEVLTGLIERGANGEAIAYFLTRIYGMPRVAVTMFRLLRNTWTKTTATAPSLPHDLAIMGDWNPPIGLLADLDIPTVAICGEKSPAALRAAHAAVREANSAIAGAVLVRQGHNVSMKALATVVTGFFADAHATPKGTQA